VGAARALLGAVPRILLPLVLVSCAAPPPPPRPAFPLDEGRRFHLAVRIEGERPYGIEARIFGGDVRSLPDAEDVPFVFVYGTPDGYDDEIVKSIYAQAPDGPREFYLDLLRWRAQHEPPIPLLPSRVEAGAETAWSGSFTVDREPVAKSATVRIESIDRDGTIVVRTTYADSPAAITRTFRRGVGMTRFEFDGAGPRVRVDVRPPP